MARRTPESQHAVEEGSLDEGHSEDRRPNHNSRLSGKEWLEDRTGEKSRIIERRGISRRLIFAATSGLESWRESKQRESFEWKRGRLFGLCRLRRLRAHPSCSLILQLGQNKVRAKPGLTPRSCPEFGYKRSLKLPGLTGSIHGATA